MENKLFELDKRLKLCADFVRKGVRVADIGTDHAYLPVWLCKNGIAISAIAADINPLPLERGTQTIIKYNAENLVKTCLSNGLSEINPDDVDDIVIAGMGGELISDIIDKAKWTKNKKYHFILQPMTKAEILRDYLYSNKFEIVEEKATYVDNKIYSVMSVYYTGEFKNYNILKKYYGMLNPCDCEYSRKYIDKVANSLINKGNGIISNDSLSFEAKNYISYGNALKKYAETGIIQNITTANDIYKFIDSIAPFSLAMDFDNSGFLAGNKSSVVNKVLISLDVTEDVINEAKKKNVQLIISHHPIIFHPLKNIMSNSIPYKIAKSGISVISAHTNLDLSPNGVNMCLANALELNNIQLYDGECIAVGNLKEEVSIKQFSLFVKEKLDCKGLRYTNLKHKIKRVAVGGGACGEYIYLAKQLGADVLVTGEIKHNYILEARDIDIAIVDVGHYKSEDVFVQPLIKILSKEFKYVSFEKSETFSDYIEYI